MLVIDEESLSCKFCFEVLQDPRVLPCGHSMCHRCIMTNVNFKKLKLKEPFLQAPIVSSDQRINKLYGSVNDQSVKEGICFNCPSCNKECKVKHAEDVSSVFPINYDLKSAVENYLMEKEKGELCVNCGTNVVQVECEDCIERFCEDCFKSIHSSKYLASHRKAPIGTMLTVGKCKKHKKDLDLICKNCKEVVCYLCSLSSSHSGHSCVPIDEHMEEAKAGMSKKIEQVDQNIGCLNVALNKVSTLQEKLVSNQESYENKVNRIIDDYLAQIEEKRKEILKKSQVEHSERMAIVQDQYSTMKGLIENMNGIKNAFEKVLHLRNVTSLITAENQIDTTLQELNCNQLDTSPIFFTQNRNPSSSEFKEFGINKAVSQIMFSYPLDIQCNIRKGSTGKAPLEVPEEPTLLIPSSSVPVSSSVPIPKVEFEKSFSNMVAESLNGSFVGKSKDEEEDVYEAFNGKKKKTRSRKR